MMTALSKGALTRDFRPLVFSHQITQNNNKAFASNSENKSTMKSPILVTAVSMKPLWQKRSSVNPNIFCVKVIDLVQDNLHMNVFSTDIPFKGSQSRSNI
jgi:hypothetical protein